MTDYPTISSVTPARQREYLIASDYALKEFGSSCTVSLGNDDCGVPDAFIFEDSELIACVELVGYVLGQINEVQSHKMVGPFTFNIDLEKSTQIHTRQPHPYTLIGKKIQGGRQYERFDAQELILLIHTEVYVKNDSLCFAMDGMMQLNPSVNNFQHHKKVIIHDLRSISQDSRSEQWDRIVLLDYTYSPVTEQCPVVNICC
jgi:hypothetical protein